MWHFEKNAKLSEAREVYIGRKRLNTFPSIPWNRDHLPGNTSGLINNIEDFKNLLRYFNIKIVEEEV